MLQICLNNFLKKEDNFRQKFSEYAASRFYLYLFFFSSTNFFKLIIFIFNWLMTALQYWFDFCHTSTWISHQFNSVQFSHSVLSDSVTPPGLPVHHQLPEFTQTHVHWMGDPILPSHPLLSPCPPTFNLSQHQDLFKWISSSCQVAKVLEFSFNISPSNEHFWIDNLSSVNKDNVISF